MNFAWILEWDLEKNISSSGPEVRGCRPVLVTFETFKDRETVFRQTKMLKKGANIDVTEDLSKRTRENRAELRKFMRKVLAKRYVKGFAIAHQRCLFSFR